MVFAVVCFFYAGSVLNTSGQNLLKTRDDTAFVMQYIYYPQMQVQMSIFFDEADFSAVRDVFTPARADSLNRVLNGTYQDARIYMQLSEVYSHLMLDREAFEARAKAKDLFLRQLQANPSDTGALANLARIFLANFDLKLARAYYQELVRIDSSSAEGWFGLGSLDLLEYKLDNAVKNMAEAIKIKPRSIAYHCQMANIQTYTGFYKIATLPDSVLEKMNYRDLMDYSYIQKAVKAFPADKPLMNIMQSLIMAGIMTEAFFDNPDLLNHTNDSVKFVLKPASRKDMVAVMEYMKKLLPGAYGKRVFPYKALMIGEFLENNPDAARRYFDEGIRINSNDRDLLSTMVGIYALNWRKKESAEMQHRYFDAYPTLSNAMVMAYLYYSIREDSLALIWTDKALQMDAGNARATAGKAAVLAQLFRVQEAAALSDLSMVREPGNREFLFLRGVIYILENRGVKGKAIFDELAKDPVYRQKCLEISTRLLQ